MIDKGRVVKSLECHLDKKTDCDDCIYNLGCNCLSLLLKDVLKLLKEQPDVVRCGDCKHYSNGFCYNPNTFDEGACGNTVRGLVLCRRKGGEAE